MRCTNLSLFALATSTLFWIVLISLITSVRAGNVARLADARIDGQSQRVKLIPNQPFRLCARFQAAYAYSGRSAETYGIPLAIVGKNIRHRKLGGVVGSGGRNRPDDVKLVQSTLTALDLFDRAVTGVSVSIPCSAPTSGANG